MHQSGFRASFCKLSSPCTACISEVNPKKARVAEMRGGKDGELWRRLADMERLCCWSAARLAKFMYISTNMVGSALSQ